ncbi:hypothetical protein [Coleofasciculus sp. E1-EBD-02]|uniref:hypothetical protein n=1 Tax=Coleofasciculus sp. E1-EBD-02 TaxID=3068481 RepID=UPI0040631F3D
MPKYNTNLELADHDYDWLILISKLSNRSLRACVQSAITFYVRRQKPEYEKILSYTARKYGLTDMECLQRLLKGESLGEPVENFSEPSPELPD